MLKQEWFAIFKDKKYFLSILVMFVIPVIYCGSLLLAFWNPYGQLDKLPVALVNEDKGTIFEDESIALGDELINNLKDSSTFNYIEVSRAEAEQMLDNGEVYISIYIPDTFSKHVTTMKDLNPEKLEIEYKVNEASNFLSSKIGESAIKEIHTEVSTEVSKTYAEQLFTALNTLSDGFGEAADGAIEVKDGVIKIREGTKDFEGYLKQIASSTQTLADGSQAIASGVLASKDGTEQLVIGSEQLLTGSELLMNGTSDLENGLSSLSSGVEQYTAGIDQIATNQQQLVDGQQAFQDKLVEMTASSNKLASGASNVAAGTAQLSTAINKLNNELSGLLSNLPEGERATLVTALTEIIESSTQLSSGAASLDEGMSSLASGSNQLTATHSTIVENSTKLSQGMQQVTASAPQLVEGAKSLTEGASTLSNKLGEFNGGVVSIVDGVNSLHNGLGEIASGAEQLATGSNTLSEKSDELASGSTKLTEGAGELLSGTEELADALADAHSESNINVTDKNYDMVASPVTINKDIKNKVENYGTGLAPYFISLGLFVGALLLTNVYKFVEPSIRPKSLVKWFISKCSVPFVVWLFQTVCLTLVLLYGLKLNVTNIPLFILLMAVTSFAFIAIVQVLYVVLGDVGKFAALIFLIIQLASSAGTFPVELLPKVFQSIHAYMPMTYSVQALRHVISATDYSVVYTNLSILSVIGICCLAITFIYFTVLYQLRYKKAEEQVITAS